MLKVIVGIITGVAILLGGFAVSVKAEPHYPSIGTIVISGSGGIVPPKP